MSAADPVAVVASLKELGANKKLITIIDGESLMNDGYFLLVPFALHLTNMYPSYRFLCLLNESRIWELASSLEHIE